MSGKQFQFMLNDGSEQEFDFRILTDNNRHLTGLERTLHLRDNSQVAQVFKFKDSYCLFLLRLIYEAIPHNRSLTKEKIEEIRAEFSSVTIDSQIKVLSNDSNPYCRYKPDRQRDKALPDGMTLVQLFESINQIRDSENRLCLSLNDNVCRFWFCWKD